MHADPELMMSASKLSRLENAQGRPIPRDIRDLIGYFGIEGTDQARRLQQSPEHRRRGEEHIYTE